MKNPTFLMIPLIAFLAACGGGPTPEQQALAEKEATNKAAFEKLMSAWGNGDKAAMSEVLAEDFMTHNPDPDIPGTGKQHLLDQMETYRAMSPDMKGDRKVLLVDGDWVAGVEMVNGTHTGAMGDMPPTGKGFDCTSIDLIRFQDGKAVEHWGLFDAMTMMHQLGMMGADTTKVAEGEPM
ncbi:MAG: ester cyclase [Flavobacteriales bacterium]